jgi:hypothetical protein
MDSDSETTTEEPIMDVMADRITARYARRYYGQRVRIAFRDGTEDTGVLLSWGPRVIRYDAPGWREISTSTVRDVVTAPVDCVKPGTSTPWATATD